MNLNYEITFEDDSVVKIKLNNVHFSIEKEAGILYELINTGEPTDVVIPLMLPSGHQIKYLYSTFLDSGLRGKKMVWGAFNTITISNNILVGCGAFLFAKVKKIVWNDCPFIPAYCFSDSEVEGVGNISNVEKIMELAFAGCAVREINWPERCDTIPEGCFADCKWLGKVIAPRVRRIEDHAFELSSITSFDWPERCSKIPDRCFASSELTKISNIDGITVIGELAFAYTRLEALDLSCANISYLAPKALAELPCDCNLIPPYYYSGEDFENAIGL